jgi:hypothetical protein
MNYPRAMASERSGRFLAPFQDGIGRLILVFGLALSAAGAGSGEATGASGSEEARLAEPRSSDSSDDELRRLESDLAGDPLLALATLNLGTSESEGPGTTQHVEEAKPEVATDLVTTQLVAELIGPELPTPTNAVDVVTPTNAVAAPAPETNRLDSGLTLALPMNVESINARLGALEQSLVLQRQMGMEVLASSHRTLITIVGIFVGMGSVVILVAALILVRVLNRLSEVVMALPIGHQIGRGPQLAALEAGETQVPVPTAVEHVSARFLGAMEQLEKRIHELEQTARNPLQEVTASQAEKPAKPEPERPAGLAEAAGDTELSFRALQQKQYGDAVAPAEPTAEQAKAQQVSLLMGKGQALLNLGQAEEALTSFEEVLGIEPKNAEALVKRGMALEKLQKVEAAIESYDRAIAADSSMTLAYLYKGAVCNRLQRFREALECYENALKSEQKAAAT